MFCMYVNLRILVLKCETVIIRAVPSFFALVPPPPLRSLVCYSYSYSFDNSFLLLTVGGQVGNRCVVAFPRPWVGGVVRR